MWDMCILVGAEFAGTGRARTHSLLRRAARRMDQPNIPVPGLGPRLRAARQARGLTQEALAAPEFTKSYVSAVEREKARPSLKALEVMARRLGVPLRDLM